jgi:hypothetical protein
LPCPCETNCGVAGGGLEKDRTDGACGAGAADGDLGYLPWGTLGLKPSDSWNTLYSYWVDRDFSDDGTGSGSVFNLDYVGSGQVRTRSPDGATTPLVASNVVVVVFSHGKNGYGGLSVDGNARPAIPAGNVDERDNTDTNSQFVSRAPSPAGATTAGGEFDDIVFWISDYEIKARMVDAGINIQPP